MRPRQGATGTSGGEGHGRLNVPEGPPVSGALMRLMRNPDGSDFGFAQAPRGLAMRFRRVIAAPSRRESCSAE